MDRLGLPRYTVTDIMEFKKLLPLDYYLYLRFQKLDGRYSLFLHQIKQHLIEDEE